MLDVITIGGATRDITFITDQGKVIETPKDLTCQRLLGFEYGAKIRSEDIRINFGGGACNAAATFAKMGLEVVVLTRIGEDEDGKAILGNLAARGVDTSLVQKDADHRTGFSFVVVNKGGAGERMIFVHKGACNGLSLDAQELPEMKWIYLSSLVGDWAAALERVRIVVEAKGCGLVWNPGATEIHAGKAALSRLLELTDIFIVNKDEAIELVKSDSAQKLTGAEYNDLQKLLGVMKDWGAQTVVITDGDNGAYVQSGNALFRSPAYVKEQVDTTGAGDAFGSGLLAGYIMTEDMETALRFGIINSGGTVRDYGAQNGIMTKEEIGERLALIDVEEIK